MAGDRAQTSLSPDRPPRSPAHPIGAAAPPPVNDAPDDAPDGTPDDDAPRRSSPRLEQERLEWLHERSGEFELLISGALLFGLLQVPGRLELWWDTLSPSLSRGGGALVFLLYFYVRVMAVTLIGAFSLHLVTRAYWVGLVGLDSVFPEGVDWDRVNYGPVAKGVYQERMSTLPQLIRKADDFGSMIFSVAFLIVIIFVISIVFGLGFGLLGWGLHATVLPSVEPTVIVVTAAVLLGVLPSLAIGVERLLAGRIQRESRAGRVVRALVGGYYKASGGAIYLPIQFTLFSRIKKTVVWPTAIALIAGLIMTLFVTELNRSAGLRITADPRIPERAGRRAVATDHFADTRAPNSAAPYIQSDIVEGPYIRLTVPFSATTYIDRLDETCPDLPPLTERTLVTSDPTDQPPDPAAEARLLDCLGQIWSVALDGRSISVDWDLSWTRRGPDGLLAYLPTEELSAGAHTIEVTRTPRPGEGSAQEGAVAEGADAEPPAGANGASGDEDEGNRPARYFIRFRR